MSWLFPGVSSNDAESDENVAERRQMTSASISCAETDSYAGALGRIIPPVNRPAALSFSHHQR